MVIVVVSNGILESHYSLCMCTGETEPQESRTTQLKREAEELDMGNIISSQGMDFCGSKVLHAISQEMYSSVMSSLTQMSEA